jgi:N-acetylglucosamine repressor
MPRVVHKKKAQIADVEGMLVKHIRAADGLSRIELAHQMGLSASTIGIYVERLIHEGYLVESGKNTSRRGRPRMKLSLNPKAGQFVGVDFCADEILAVAIDFAQQVVAEARTPLRAGESTPTVLHALENTLAKVLPRRRKTALAIGVGCPGPVDIETGCAIEYPYIRGFHNVPLAERLQKRFRIPVSIENTCNTMALAELWFGHGRALNNFVCIWDRSGIGAGIVVDRKIYRGVADGAGEIGFWQCPVTLRGGRQTLRPLQEVASVRAILDRMRAPGKRKGTRPQFRDIEQAFLKGNTRVHAILADVAHHLGYTVAQLGMALAPEAIILAGPLTTLRDALLEPVRTIVKNAYAPTHRAAPSLICSDLGPFSGALGAAALAVDTWKPPR